MRGPKPGRDQSRTRAKGRDRRLPGRRGRSLASLRPGQSWRARRAAGSRSPGSGRTPWPVGCACEVGTVPICAAIRPSMRRWPPRIQGSRPLLIPDWRIQKRQAPTCRGLPQPFGTGAVEGPRKRNPRAIPHCASSLNLGRSVRSPKRHYLVANNLRHFSGRVTASLQIEGKIRHGLADEEATSGARFHGWDARLSGGRESPPIRLPRRSG